MKGSASSRPCLYHFNTPGTFLCTTFPFSPQIRPPAANLAALQLNTLNYCCSLTWETGVAFLYFPAPSQPRLSWGWCLLPSFLFYQSGPTNQSSNLKPFWRILPGENQQNSLKTGKICGWAIVQHSHGKDSAQSQEWFGQEGTVKTIPCAHSAVQREENSSGKIFSCLSWVMVSHVNSDLATWPAILKKLTLRERNITVLRWGEVFTRIALRAQKTLYFPFMWKKRSEKEISSEQRDPAGEKGCCVFPPVPGTDKSGSWWLKEQLKIPQVVWSWELCALTAISKLHIQFHWH